MPQTKNLSYLESLKGISIILIIMMHCGASNLPGLVGAFGSDMGTMGVAMFMLISGILSFISLDHVQTSSKNISKWYLKRYFRLLPLYVIAIVLTLVTNTYSVYWLGAEKSVSIWNILTHIIFAHGLFPHYCNSILSVEWYLGALALFYLITPLLYKLISNIDKALVALIISLIACPIINSFIYKLMPVAQDPTIYDAYKNTFSPIRILPVYMLGIFLFFVIRQLSDTKANNQIILSYILIGFSLIMIIGQFTGANTLFHFSSYLMYALWFSILIIGLIYHNTVLIDNPFWRILGRYSYPMYLFQYLFIFLFERYLGKYNTFAIKFIAVTAILFIISIATTKLIDNPLQKKLKELFKL